MPQWNKKGTDITQTFDSAQGREITLDNWRVPWKLITYHKSGQRLDLGIWGKDELNRDIVIYNGPYGDGQELIVDAKYQAVHVAIGFTPNNPPKVQRWFFQGQWWRQGFFNSEAQIELYYYS